MKQSYKFVPRDLLFFRDGRPIDANKANDEMVTIGHGAYWPRPDHLYNGVMHALLNDRGANGKTFWDDAMLDEADCRGCGIGKFGSLKIEGPFPMKGETLYLPRPLDWDCHLVKVDDTDLPPFLTHGFIDNEEGKKDYPAWISLAEYKDYLKRFDLMRDPKKEAIPKLKREDLFSTESRIGTTLDARTGASARKKGDASGQYQAEYLRLEKDVSLWGSVACRDEELSKSGVADIPQSFILGGQGGVVNVEKNALTLNDTFPVPKPQAGKDGLYYVRWTLLTPAYFSQTGWLPGWCKDTSSQNRPEGEVCFAGCEGVKLVAACTGKPIIFSGWDSEYGVKPTKLVVPAGSSYVFACPDEAHANALVQTLHLQRKSDFGSQGFGLGVCSFIAIGTEAYGYDKPLGTEAYGYDKLLGTEAHGYDKLLGAEAHGYDKLLGAEA